MHQKLFSTLPTSSFLCLLHDKEDKMMLSLGLLKIFNFYLSLHDADYYFTEVFIH